MTFNVLHIYLFQPLTIRKPKYHYLTSIHPRYLSLLPGWCQTDRVGDDYCQHQYLGVAWARNPILVDMVPQQ